MNSSSSKMASLSATDKSKMASSSLWQHPYVDIFKHFKIIPVADWKSNKKQGDVTDVFAKEIGRKVLNLQGSISANNFIQIPHPNGLQKSLNLTGRFIYLEVKTESAGNPFAMHFDFAFAERSHNVRVSVSNLFKSFHTSNGFVIQCPLEIQSQRWSVVVLDLFEIFKMSQIFPPTYRIEAAHSLKSITLCASLQIRGVYTSDNLYDYQSLPSDMKFKFSFDISRWEEYFSWNSLPMDLDQYRGSVSNQSVKKIGAKEATLQGSKGTSKAEERKKMQQEIDTLLQRDKQVSQESQEEEQFQSQRKSRVGLLPEIGLTSPPEDKPVTGFLMNDRHKSNNKNKQYIASLQANKSDYVSGSFIGVELKRSPKLNVDPVLELKHIIGYSPDKCLNLKWSKFLNENVVIFTSGGTLIAMDVDTNTQKRFFFGHSAPICCFDINSNGSLLASAQEGKNSIIRIWEYSSGRCISMVTMPVNTLKCLSFSYDGRYLASSGKDAHNREILIVWDITRIAKGEKPEIVARQTSDFNILCLRFSPIDSSRLASCGKENIRFWRIKDNGVIRGSAVVLNHHARNTVFTSLDFEYGFKSNDPKENESLKRVFVGSKHGMVFQVNYHTENLEATYQTNDSAIYSIAVNEAFCVTGSEDTYLRVWPLDFSEFFMEAKHEGTVCAVDISQDGLKVVCGTSYGSLGILDKSNQKYRTLLRSHTDQILNMDFHLLKRNIITVSRDKTIRLWDIENSDQVYEFSSPIDQPLTVAAHPYLPLFGCGFESGALRIFDIEKTCVAVEFSQFNKPLQKLAYSPFGDLLIACCVDGGVAIHNPKRQHQAIKMMHLEFPPEFVHVAFSSVNGSPSTLSNHGSLDQDENADPNEQVVARHDSRFAIMGEYGNNVNIYDSTTFFVVHQIQASQTLRSFSFANNNRDFILVTTDCKVKFYSLAKYEGIFLREITTVHRGNVMSLNVSNNCGYMLTGGEDSMIKVWDYEAQKTVPFFFQSFIGHTYPVVSVLFNPTDNGVVLSAGEKDGIYLWEFHGDTKTQYAHQPVDQLKDEQSLGAAGSIKGNQQQTLSRSFGQQPSILEKMRTTRKEIKKQGAMSEDTFILPQFKQVPQIDPYTIEFKREEEEGEGQKQLTALNKIRDERGLSYIHYADCSQQINIDLDEPTSHIPSYPSQLDGIPAHPEERPIEAQLVNGYDGFGGVHDNLVWNSQAGWAAYTLYNKLIFENTKTREQTVIIDSSTQLSTMALSPDKKLLAIAEGKTNKRGNSVIYLYDAQTRKQTSKLTFHQRGVQSIAFSNDSNYLISVAVQGENTLAVWDLAQGLVIKSAMIKHNAINQIRVDPYIEDAHIQFCTVGSQGAFTFWRLDLQQNQFQNYDVVVPMDLQGIDFTSISFTPYYGAPYHTYLILLGLSNGQLAGYDQKNQGFVENMQRNILNEQVGCIACKNGFVVAGSQSGLLTKYPTTHSVFAQADYHVMEADGAIVALAMDDLNNEGMVGTSNGTIYYLNFDEKILIKLVSSSSANGCPDAVTCLQFNQQNPNLLLTSSGANSSQVKLWATNTVDQVMKFGGPPYSAVKFILSNPKSESGRLALVGHRDGMLKLISVENLNTEAIFKLDMNENEELEAATYNPNGVNFAVGTNHGNIFLGSQRDEGNGKIKLLVGKLDNIQRLDGSLIGVKCLHFSTFDPIGSMLVAYEDGLIKTWQSSIKNEQFMQLLEYQQQSREKALLDLAECGYQQFDLLDKFDIFENPHGQEDLSEDERHQLKLLYSGKKQDQCHAQFAPGPSSGDIHYSMVSGLQYIFVRNYVQRCIVKRVSLMHFPTCIQLVDYTQLQLNGVPTSYQQQQGGETVLVCVGTKEGLIQIYRVDSQGYSKLAQSKGGLCYGAVTGVDVSPQAEKLAISTESGELITFNLLEHLESLQQQQQQQYF